jgi:ABC-type uncharacterized transport system ATPase subunit
MLLEARDVTKAFGSFKAVDAASVTLEQGDILGLIGELEPGWLAVVPHPADHCHHQPGQIPGDMQIEQGFGNPETGHSPDGAGDVEKE